jgi:hypothetical protein
MESPLMRCRINLDDFVSAGKDARDPRPYRSGLNDQVRTVTVDAGKDARDPRPYRSGLNDQVRTVIVGAGVPR